MKKMYLLGYHKIQSRDLVAADYGAPTIRKRWYAVFRRDGKDIVWPEPTHNRNGTDGKEKWVPVSTVLNFSDLGKSIFGRKKPLAENTLKRTARGLEKFVFNNPEPFIIQVNHSGPFRGQKTDQPLPTITQKHGFGVITPVTVPISDKKDCVDPSTSSNNGKKTLRMKSSDDKNQLLTPMLIQYHSETTKNGVRGQKVSAPLQTIDTSNRYGLVIAFLEKFYKSGIGQSINEPLHTITTSAGHFGQISVYAVEWTELLKAGISEGVAQKATWCSQFIMEYYGCGTGQSIKEPLHTIVTKDRFALITILGTEYAILDIYLRMLTPEELKLAQGFPKDYIINRDYTWKPFPISEQVKRIGNSVVPIMAEKLVGANCPYMKTGTRRPAPIVYTQTNGQVSFG